MNHKKPQLSILKLDSSDNKALMGAKIKVAKTNGEIVGTFTSDANGLVILTDLEAGSYTITEIAAPDGYILDSTPQIVELKAGEAKQIELYNTAKPGLQLRKIDKLTNLPVGGAVFSLVRLESGAKRDLGTYTTGENGLFYVPDLAPGDYVITEIKAPDSYILDSTPKNIYVEGGKLNTVEVFNTPYSSLRILKISADEDRKPLEGAVFKLYDEKRLEVGIYTTSALGEILIPSLPSGIYFLQEQKAPTGYVLDTTVRQIELIGGKTTTVEWKNTALGSLRIIKLDKETKKPLYGATFLLYDSRNNLLGEFTTNQMGLITFGSNLQAGKYKLKEIKAPDEYVLDEMMRTITVTEGETTEIVVENEAKRGRIQIQKVSSSYNDLTKDKEGTALKGAKFEIYNNKMELVDTIESDKNGLCTSDYLPLGVYGIKEVSCPNYYISDGERFYAELKIHDDLVKFKVVNKPVHIETSVEKRGVVEAMAGSSIYYDFTGIENKSNVPLKEFYWHDVLPIEAVRLEKIWTGVWNERVSMELQIKTNLKTSYRSVKKGLLSTVNNEIDCSRSVLGLAANEYVTEFRLVFGEVQPEFHETTGVKIQVKVLDIVENGQKFTNKTDVGGRYIDKWVYQTDGWTSVAYNKPKGDLPKTGY